MTNQPVICFQNFTFRYASNLPNALDSIDLCINSGEIILLGGISGSGKSTLCNAIAGRIPHIISGQMKGKYHLFDQEIWHYSLEELAQQITYVFQNADEQLVTFTVYDEIAFAAENYQLTMAEIETRVQKISSEIGITHLLHRSIHTLSGGEKQKVVLAANLILEPKILILDEPLAFLDQTGEKLLVDTLKKMHKLHPELIIIIVEHRLTPFVDILNRIVLLDEYGKKVFDGDISTYSQFQQDNRKIFLRDLQFNTGNSKKLHNQTNSDSEWLIRFEKICYRYPGTDSNILNNFDFNIKKNEFLGIVGENGCGKTTLFYLLARILDPDQGSRYYNNINYENIQLSDFLPKIGFIFQNPENQIFESTVKEEILYAIRNFSQFTSSSQIEQKNLLNMQSVGVVEKMLTLIGEQRQNDQAVAEQNPFRLSWGQKRRLNLASIFSYEPEIILVDEPFIGQDAQATERIFDILTEFHKKGKTIIIISHDRDLLQTYCTRIWDFSHVQQISTESKSQMVPNSSKTPVKNNKKKDRINLFLKQAFQPQTEKGWLQKIHPVVKLGIIMSLSISLFFQQSIIMQLLCFGFVLAVISSAKFSVPRLMHQIRWILLMTLIYVPLNTLFDANYTSNTEILFYFFTPDLPIRRIALYYALRTGIIIIILVSIAIIFTQSTHPKTLVYGLISVGCPYRYAFAFMIGLRYIPIIQNENRTIEIAQTLRGAGIHKKSNLRQVSHHILVRMSTLLISVLRKAKTTSMTIDARGFGYAKIRTNRIIIKLTKEDYFIIGLFTILLTLYILTFVGNPLNFVVPSLYQIFLSVINR
jgi:energy-coupling factor transport system ATP-binding protein